MALSDGAKGRASLYNPDIIDGLGNTPKISLDFFSEIEKNRADSFGGELFK
jgi:hypothetical protein